MQDRGQNLLRGFDAHRRWSCVRALEIGTAVREQTAVVVQRPYRRPTPVPNSHACGGIALVPHVHTVPAEAPPEPRQPPSNAPQTASRAQAASPENELLLLAGRRTPARDRLASEYAFAFGPGRPRTVRGGNPGRVRGAVETGLRRCARAAGAVVPAAMLSGGGFRGAPGGFGFSRGAGAGRSRARRPEPRSSNPT